MDIFNNPMDFMAMVSVILVLLLEAHSSLHLIEEERTIEASEENSGLRLDFEGPSSLHLDGVTHAAMHQLQLWSALSGVEEDLGFWVKPRSMTWFSKFLLQEYEDERWIQMFRMTKSSVLSLARLLHPAIKKKNTRYRAAVPVVVRVACSLFKLSHGATLLVCSELFAVGRSTVCVMLHDVVHAVNVALPSEMIWPTGESLRKAAIDFQHLCSLPGVVGAIDGMQIPIIKPRFDAADYYYFKSGAYSMNCQAVVDSSKRFLDLYVGMPGSTNDARMLRRSTLYRRGQCGTLWDTRRTFTGFTLYLLGDAGYSLLSWLMVPHRQHQQLSVVDRLFNKKMSKGRCVIENAFAQLKQSFRELEVKSELHVAFLPDVVFCCCLLHNVLLKQSHEEVEHLLEVLRLEQDASCEHEQRPLEEFVPLVADERNSFIVAFAKRRQLGLFLVEQRLMPT